jgi:linoleoyl-CoA desaturase
MQEKIVFTGQNDSGFYGVLKKRVETYFKEQNLSPKFNKLMVAKSTFYIVGCCLVYCLLLFGGFSQWGMLGLSALLGFFISGIGFNVGHDSVHGAYFSSPRANKILGFSFDMVGASSYTWKIRHNIIHHTFTNVIGSDGDLESTLLLRLCLRPGRRWIHQFQHWYAAFFYGFISLVWVLKKDYAQMIEESRGLNSSRRKPPVRAYVSLISFKLLHYFLFIGLPYLVLQIALWKVLLGFFTMHYIAGFILASVFQMAHVVEGPIAIFPTKANAIEDSWAAHQMKTTANFEPRALSTWICGGLNYQIEHHLFPNICHIHYPAISPIVQKTAKEFNLPYYVHRTFFKAFCSHIRLLKYYGQTDYIPAT